MGCPGGRGRHRGWSPHTAPTQRREGDQRGGQGGCHGATHERWAAPARAALVSPGRAGDGQGSRDSPGRGGVRRDRQGPREEGRVEGGAGRGRLHLVGSPGRGPSRRLLSGRGLGARPCQPRWMLLLRAAVSRLSWAGGGPAVRGHVRLWRGRFAPLNGAAPAEPPVPGGRLGGRRPGHIHLTPAGGTSSAEVGPRPRSCTQEAETQGGRGPASCSEGTGSGDP